MVQRDKETEAIEVYIMTRLFPERLVTRPTSDLDREVVDMLVPYKFRPSGDLVITQKIDEEAWRAVRDMSRITTEDLPSESMDTRIDQPAAEIVSLAMKITSEAVSLQASAIRRDHEMMVKSLDHLSLFVRAAGRMANLQHEAATTYP